MAKTVFGKALSRRSFLKTSGGIVGAAAVGSLGANSLVALAEDTAPADTRETLFSGSCRGNCAGGCPLYVHVRDGKVVRTSARKLPNDGYTRICSKGLSHPVRMYSPQRLQYPLKRTGERGSGEFERITWEQAFKEIGEIWRKVREESGPTALATLYGSGNYGMVNGIAGPNLVDRLNSAAGASSVSLSVDMALGLAVMRASGYAPIMGLGELSTTRYSKAIFVWGANPTVCQPHSVHWLVEARERGARLVVIDPCYGPTAALADWHIPIKAGTDGILALAMLNVILENGWQNDEYLKQHSTAPFLVKKDDGMFLREADLGEVKPVENEDGTVDMGRICVCGSDGKPAPFDEVKNPKLAVGAFKANGIEVCSAYDIILEKLEKYTLEYAEKATGIPAADIRELARVFYAEGGPTMIYTFFGINQYGNGHYSYADMLTLSAFTGNLGRLGGGCGNNECSGTIPWNAMAAVPEGAPGAGPSVPIYLMNEVLDSKSYGLAPLDMRAVLVTCSDLMCNSADHNRIEEAFSKLDNIVVMDMVLTDTAKYADYVLPAAYWFEKRDVGGHWNNSSYAVYQEVAVEPAFEAKPDFEIIKNLAHELDLDEFFDFDEDGWIDMICDTDLCRQMGITRENLMKEKVVRSYPGEDFNPYDGYAFLTGTGRAEVYVEAPFTLYYNGQELDPTNEHTIHWEPPFEAGEDNELAAKFPFHAIAERSRFRTHVQWWEVDTLNEILPEPLIKINPHDAEEKGIKAGDYVRAFNDRGEVVMRAAMHAGLSRGTVMIPKGWQKHQIKQGTFNAITTSRMSNYVNNAVFSDARVDIEKA